jgi:type I restriction enzyme, R subunit
MTGRHRQPPGRGDWQFRDSVRAKMRILIRQRLRKYKDPPEGCEEAIGLVLKQAAVFAKAMPGQGGAGG